MVIELQPNHKTTQITPQSQNTHSESPVSSHQFQSTLASTTANPLSGFLSTIWYYVSCLPLKAYEWIKWILCGCSKREQTSQNISSTTSSTQSIYQLLLSDESKSVASKQAENPRPFFKKLFTECLRNPKKMKEVFDNNCTKVWRFATDFKSFLNSEDSKKTVLKFEVDFANRHHSTLTHAIIKSCEEISQVLEDNKNDKTKHFLIFFKTFIPAFVKKFDNNTPWLLNQTTNLFNALQINLLNPGESAPAVINEYDLRKLDGFKSFTEFNKAPEFFNQLKSDLQEGTNFLGIDGLSEKMGFQKSLEEFFQSRMLAALNKEQLEELACQNGISLNIKILGECLSKHGKNKDTTEAVRLIFRYLKIFSGE